MNAEKIIARNSPESPEWSDESFIAIFHDKSIWDTGAYWDIEWALYNLHREDVGHEARWRIFSYVAIGLSCHFDANDYFKITNLSSDEIFDYRERFQLVFEGFFQGKMPKQELFSIDNPRFQE